MQTETPHHTRRFYPIAALTQNSAPRPDGQFPYDGWMPRRTHTGKVVMERLKGRRGFRAEARAQTCLALAAAARCRHLGLRDAARVAVADAAQWRDRERTALARGSESDLLWSAHRAVLRSDPSTWREPWTLTPIDLRHGMVLRDSLVRR